MVIAVNKDVKEKNDNYLCIFDDNDNINDLIKTGLHCKHKDYVKKVDINTTNYNINCIKKSKYGDKDWDVIPDKKDYKFAIIVPNCNNDHGKYNGKTFLANCIESIINQTYKGWNLIIIDDCSDDTSVETIKSYKDDRITLLQNKRKRYNGGSRNVGIDYAKEHLDYDYICFLDSDDWWIDGNVLATINSELYDHDMLIFDMHMLNETGYYSTKHQIFNTYEEFFFSTGSLWCTAWSRVIKKDKIAYFCEDTLMEDRVWSYRQADNVDYDKVKHIDDVLYVWNRMNYNGSVSLTRGNYWDASAWCHIGHQSQLRGQLKHKEMIPILDKRIERCKELANMGTYTQE